MISAAHLEPLFTGQAKEILSNKDIRELISNLTSKLNDKADYSFFNILSEKIIELEDKVNIIQNEYNALEKIENLLKEV